jgi:hypothetical protein
MGGPAPNIVADIPRHFGRIGISRLFQAIRNPQPRSVLLLSKLIDFPKLPRTIVFCCTATNHFQPLRRADPVQ